VSLAKSFHKRSSRFTSNQLTTDTKVTVNVTRYDTVCVCVHDPRASLTRVVATKRYVSMQQEPSRSNSVA